MLCPDSGCFQFGAVMTKSAVKVRTEVLLWTHAFIPLGEYLEVGFLGCEVSCTL